MKRRKFVGWVIISVGVLLFFMPIILDKLFYTVWEWMGWYEGMAFVGLSSVLGIYFIVIGIGFLLPSK